MHNIKKIDNCLLWECVEKKKEFVGKKDSN